MTLTENQGLFFQAEDKNGNIIATNGLAIFKIGTLAPENFEVTTNNDGNLLIFTPRIKGTGDVFNDIYFKMTNTENVGLASENNLLNNISSEYSDFNKLTNGQTYRIATNSVFAQNTTLYFEVRNKNTKQVMLTKTFDFTIHNVTAPEINSGTVNGENVPIGSPGSTTTFQGLNENSSISDLMNFSKEGLNTYQQAFLILPGFVWTYIAIILAVALILRVLGR